MFIAICVHDRWSSQLGYKQVEQSKLLNKINDLRSFTGIVHMTCSFLSQ